VTLQQDRRQVVASVRSSVVRVRVEGQGSSRNAQPSIVVPHFYHLKIHYYPSEKRAMTTNVEFSPATRFLLVAGAFVLVIADLHAAASLITPFLLAGLIAVIAALTMFYFMHRGTPA